MWTFDKKKISVKCDVEQCISEYSSNTTFIFFENLIFDLGWRFNKKSDFCKECSKGEKVY